MRLNELAHLKENGFANIDICGLTADSRHVQPGYLFAALAGVQADGKAYVGQAIDNGAAAILTDAPLVAGVPVIASDNPRRDLALMASRFFEFQPAHIAAITGTNGKTSTAVFLRQLLQAAGHKSASMGTLGVEAEGYYAALAHTTPEPVHLHAALRDLVAHEVTHVAMEASSHGLAQHRLDGVRLSVAGFTNISRDHMDYHPTPEAYEAAKTRLFTEVLAADGVAVIVMTHPVSARLAEACAAAERTVKALGRVGDDVHIALSARGPSGLELVVSLGDSAERVRVPLIGDFQIENLTLALGMAQAMGVADAVLLAALKNIEAPRGRMQLAGRKSNGAAIFVDYAHTPDALENALTALRAHLPEGGRLSVVFGCGGDRDAGKRSQMGAAAATAADKIYVTDDNPRSENADSIRAEICAACPDAVNIGDRAAAIETAIEAAGAEDLVLLAGKGHETGQIIGDMIVPFDDVTVAREFLTESGGAHG